MASSLNEPPGMTRCAHEHWPHPVASPTCPSQDYCSALAARISHSCLPTLADPPPNLSPHCPGSALSQLPFAPRRSPPSHASSLLFFFLFLLLSLPDSSPVSLMLTTVPAAHAQQQHPSAAPAPQSNKYHDVRVGCGGGGCPIHDGHGQREQLHTQANRRGKSPSPGCPSHVYSPLDTHRVPGGSRSQGPGPTLNRLRLP